MISRLRGALSWYGSDPLHLLVLAGCFALAGYAGLRLWAAQPLGVTVWLLAPIIAHDLVLVPLYALADRSLRRILRHRPGRAPTVPVINHVRVPVLLSLLLLLVYFPLILRLPQGFFAAVTSYTMQPYLARYLGIVGALFLASAVAYAVRLRR